MQILVQYVSGKVLRFFILTSSQGNDQEPFFEYDHSCRESSYNNKAGK